MTTEIPEERAFTFANGARARSLEEFARIVRDAPVDVIDYHRLHVVPWLADVVGDRGLAARARHYAESGMSADEYRRVLADLAERRARERDEAPAAEARPPRHARLT